MATRWSWWRLPASLALLLAAGCTQQGARPRPAPGAEARPAPAVAWQPATLPATGPGRPTVRDVAACPGHWYAAGGYQLPDGSTRPALWTSPDAATWTELPVHPVSFYGPRQLLTAVACRGDAAVAMGSAAGGAHGNPRISSWLSGAGRLDEVPAAFELYGGTDAVGTGPLAAGPTGWLITGVWRDANGAAGAAVWFAGDAREFRRVDADPELESDSRGQTTALDAVSGPAGGFTLVGSLREPASRTAARDPVAWTSTDGLTWRRAAVPATADEDETLDRAVPYRGGVLAVGERGDGFGAWLGGSGGWRATGRFGGFAGTGLPLVTGLAAGSQRAYAVASDGDRYRLWSSADGASWGELALPATVPVGGPRRVGIAGTGGRLLLAAEDGGATRLWSAPG